ncbi:MAG TPA: flagellar biosynthetic protein FliO [Afipia sp.]
MPQMLWIVVSILIVLALIGVVAWLVRRFAGNNIGASGNRGRMPRLAVIDAAAVDGRRRLVLVRRDNVEHLIMIGGPTDLVVEPNITRNTHQRDQVPSRGPVGTELPARVSPLPDAPAAWADNDPGHDETFDFPEPSVVPERAARQSHFEEPRRPSPSIADRGRGDEFNGLVPEPITREPARELRPEPRSERVLPRSERTEPAMPRMPRAADVQPRSPIATPRSAARASEPAASSADQNLAEMAQRLEAALRRPGDRPDTAAGRSVAIDPMDRVGAPSVAPEPPAPRVSREPANAPRNAPAAPKPAFDNLEDEMASLLGRPKTPT